MTIDFSQKVVLLNGEPVKLQDEKGEREASLGELLYKAFELPNEEDSKMSFPQKQKVYCVLKKVYPKKSKVGLKAEEVVLLKERAGRVFKPAVLGAVVELLEPGTQLEAVDNE